MDEDRRPGDRQGSGARTHEIGRAEADAIGKALQPALQIVPGDRPGDGVGDQDRGRELPQQQQDHIPHPGAEYFADADLPGAAADREGSEPEQSQAGDEDGDTHEYAEHLALTLIGLIQLAEIVFQEVSLHRLCRRETVPGPVYERKGLWYGVGPEADHGSRHQFRIVEIDRGLGGLARTAELRVGKHANDIQVPLSEDDALTDCLLWRKTEPGGCGLVYQDIMSV